MQKYELGIREQVIRGPDASADIRNPDNHRVDNLFYAVNPCQEENDEGWCNTECCYPCKVWWYHKYKKDFLNSRITIEDHGRILEIFGLEYFFVDRQGHGIDTYRDGLLFRKDGELTIQRRKVSYDLDGNAEIDKSDPEVRIPIIYGDINYMI